MSAYYHLMRSHSLRVFRKLLTLDISGIALCIGAADLLVSYAVIRILCLQYEVSLISCKAL